MHYHGIRLTGIQSTVPVVVCLDYHYHTIRYTYSATKPTGTGLLNNISTNMSYGLNSSAMVRSVFKWFDLFLNGSICFKMVRSVFKWFDLFRNGSICFWKMDRSSKSIIRTGSKYLFYLYLGSKYLLEQGTGRRYLYEQSASHLAVVRARQPTSIFKRYSVTSSISSKFWLISMKVQKLMLFS